MRGIRRVGAIVAGFACGSAALAAFVEACSSDDRSLAPQVLDAHLDTMTDQAVDHADAKEDVQPDVGPDGSESDPDGITFLDVTDAGSIDVTLKEFPEAVDTAYCRRLAACCSVVDAGAFVARCLASFAGYSASGNLNLANTSSPHVTFNTGKAKACLEQIAAYPCGSVTAAQIELNAVTCASAIQGDLTAGAGPCTSSFDCVSGAYCPRDGGVCTPLSDAGGLCKDFTYSTDCTFLGNGVPSNYCNPDSGTCQPDHPNGSTCFEYEECQSQLCVMDDAGIVCTTAAPFSTAAICAAP
jgi:hypothetical protein